MSDHEKKDRCPTCGEPVKTVFDHVDRPLVNGTCGLSTFEALESAVNECWEKRPSREFPEHKDFNIWLPWPVIVEIRNILAEKERKGGN